MEDAKQNGDSELQAHSQRGNDVSRDREDSETDPDDDVLKLLRLLPMNQSTQATDSKSENKGKCDSCNDRDQLESELKEEKARHAATQEEMKAKIQELEAALKEQTEKGEARYDIILHKYLSAHRETVEQNFALDVQVKKVGLLIRERDTLKAEVSALKRHLDSCAWSAGADLAQLMKDNDGLRNLVDQLRVQNNDLRYLAYNSSQTVVVSNHRYESVASLASNRLVNGPGPNSSLERLGG